MHMPREANCTYFSEVVNKDDIDEWRFDWLYASGAVQVACSHELSKNTQRDKPLSIEAFSSSASSPDGMPPTLLRNKKESARSENILTLP